MYLDIELIKSVGGTESAVTNTTGKISVSIKLSSDLINTDSAKKRTYKVARIHGDVVDMLDAAFDEATGKLTFETDKFSTYAVVYVDELAGSVDTGDNSPIALFIGIAIVSVIVLAGLAFFSLKDKSRK